MNESFEAAVRSARALIEEGYNVNIEPHIQGFLLTDTRGLIQPECETYKVSAERPFVFTKTPKPVSIAE